MSDTQSIRKRLADIIQKTGHTYRELSLKIGRKEAYIQQYIKYGLPKRLNEIDRKKLCRLLEIDEHQLMDDEIFSAPQDVNAHTDKITVDIYSLQPNKAWNSIGKLTIPLRELNLNDNSKPCIIKMFGDYMEPTLTNGDFVFFDLSYTDFCGDGIYVLELNGTTYIKRIQQPEDEQLRLIADNPLYASINVASDKVKILGRATHRLSSKVL